MTISFVTLLTLTFAASGPPAETVPALVAVAAGGASEHIEFIRGRTHATLAVPYTSRSEVVARAKPSARGVVFRLYGGIEGVRVDRAQVRAVRHGADEQLLLAEDAAWLVGAPTLPAEVRSETGDLAFLARQDRNVVRGGTLRLVPPPGAAGRHLVLIGAREAAEDVGWTIRVDGNARFLPADERRTTLLPASEKTIVVELGDAPLDQAFFTNAVEAPADEQMSLALRNATLGAGCVERLAPRGPVVDWSAGDEAPIEVAAERLSDRDGERIDVEPGRLLELSFEAPPPAADGETWTLLLEIDLDATPPPVARSPRAAAVRRGFLVDVAATAGVRKVHFEGPDEQLDIRPTMGPGAAWGDVDGDGLVDLYLVQGGGRAGAAPLPNRLFRNRGDGTFADVTRDSGAGHTGAGMGALFFDVDGDRDLDLYVANYGADALFLGDGAGRFTDVSHAVGVGGDLWSAGIAASDFDRDGDLDVYVTSYLEFDLDKAPPPDELGRYRREDPVPMLPFAFPGQRNTFLRNDGDSATPRFTDVAAELGLLDEQGRGMQPVFWDFDRDGDDDLYVANDVSLNVLFSNQGDGSFEDVSFSTGLDDPRGGMGLAVGDVDRDGDEDVFLTNWQLEANALYVNNTVQPFARKHRRSSFRDATVASGLGPAGIGVTSWGAVLFDADNDGDLDLFVANGYTSPDYESTGICVGQPNQFFLNEGDGRFRDASRAAGPDVAVELASRCVVPCDYDQDGRVDLVVTANNGRVQLLHNEWPDPGHWLGVRLVGPGGNAFGVGAEVTVRAGDLLLRRSLRAGGSYLGGVPPELHFGLGSVSEIDAVEVRWPSGRATTHRVDGVDRFVVVREE